MTDPLSITGNAVGVISLGLVVCGKIVEYGRAYKGYRDDIQQMITKAEAVCTPLKVLREIIEMTQINQPDTAIDLSESVMRIDASITRLRNKIERYGPANNPDGSPDIVRNQARRIIYRFRKDALRDMGLDLDHMQATLRTLISAYHWKDAICARQEAREMHLLFKSGVPLPSLSQAWYDSQKEREFSIKSDKSVLSEKNAFAKQTEKKALAKQSRKEVKKNFSSYSRWLGLMITASLNISMDAGGIFIYPTLSVQIPVSNSREIHQLFKEIVRMEDHESAILRLQDEFSNQRLHPSCVLSRQSIPESLIDTLIFEFVHNSYRHTRIFMEIIAFLFDSGVKAVNSYQEILWKFPWNLNNCQKQYMTVMERVIESGLHTGIPYNRISGPSPYWNINWKENFRLILSIDDEAVQMPEVAKIVLRRDAEGLRKALCQKRLIPKDSESREPFDLSWLLLLAEGWVDGIKVLLEFGADARQFFQDLDRPGEEHHHSSAILLRAGCFFTKLKMAKSYSLYDKGERMHLFINELRARREKLRNLADACLPSKLIPAGNSLLDGPDGLRVYELLISRAKSSVHSIPPGDFFFPSYDSYSESVYHHLSQKQCAEALYKAGFRATCMLDLNGNSPLGTMGMLPNDSNRNLMEIIHWHISKGLDVHHRLPWADESVAHLLIIDALLRSPHIRAIRRLDSPEVIHDHTKEHTDELEEELHCFKKIHTALFPSPSVPDGCSCLCSPSGLTAASLMCREYITFSVFRFNCFDCLRHVFIHFLEWEESHGKNPLAFIRALTFTALDLTHTCFDKTKKGYIQARNRRPDNEDYIDENCNEHSSITEFENLQAELELEFDQLRVPLKEFVAEHWYKRVKDHILTPQTLDERHITDARKIGVDLEDSGLFVPEWIELLIAPKVEEVEVASGWD